MKVADHNLVNNPKLSPKAKAFLSFDTELVRADEIWVEHADLYNGKKVYTADIDTIEMYRSLSKLPKIDDQFVIPHPTKTDTFLSKDEFGEVCEQTDLYGDVESECWEYSDDEAYLVLIKK